MIEIISKLPFVTRPNAFQKEKKMSRVRVQLYFGQFFDGRLFDGRKKLVEVCTLVTDFFFAVKVSEAKRRKAGKMPSRQDSNSRPEDQKWNVLPTDLRRLGGKEPVNNYIL